MKKSFIVFKDIQKLQYVGIDKYFLQKLDSNPESLKQIIIKLLKIRMITKKLF